MNELALFAGAGGGILGGHLLGWRTICAVERDAYAAQVLAQRQNDGALPAFPIWSDVCTFEGKPWKGLVDVVSGGFPCQDISIAGAGAGLDGERSGLWRQFRRIIGETMPSLVYVENSPMLTVRGLATVLADLAQLGFDAEWGIVSAEDCGAPHLRKRIWLVAYRHRSWQLQCALRQRQQRNRISYCRKNVSLTNDERAGWRLKFAKSRKTSGGMANSMRQRQQRIVASISDAEKRPRSQQRPTRSCSHGFGRWPAEPDVGRVAHGVAARVDRLKALGNGQVPRVAAAAFTLLARRAGLV